MTRLARYLRHRQETQLGGELLFVSDDGQPLVYRKVHSVFRTLLKSTGLKPQAVDGPAFMSFAIHLLSGPWSRLQLAANELGSTC
jgi:site-specific recombinase XerC